MAAGTGQDSRGPGELCPTCNCRIVLKPVGDSLLSFNLDGTVHRCWPRSEPMVIGLAVQGKTILNFSLKKRRVTLTLSDDTTLEISANSDDELVAMNLLLLSPEGKFEEKR